MREGILTDVNVAIKFADNLLAFQPIFSEPSVDTMVIVINMSGSVDGERPAGCISLFRKRQQPQKGKE